MFDKLMSVVKPLIQIGKTKGKGRKEKTKCGRTFLNRTGGEWARCDQMGSLENYTFLESSDHVDNRKKLFFH